MTAPQRSRREGTGLCDRPLALSLLGLGLASFSCGGPALAEEHDAALADASPALRDSSASDGAPDAAGCPAPSLVYLNTEGISLTDSMSIDSVANTHPVEFLFNTSDLPAWSGTALSEVLPCLESIFSGFNVAFTALDPGQLAHLEVVFTGPSTSLITVLNVDAYTLLNIECGLNANSMGFVFDDAWVDNDHLCRGMAQVVGVGLGLEVSNGCADISARLNDCPEPGQSTNPGTITSTEHECGYDGISSKDDVCICDSTATTQNSQSRLSQLVGPACPAL